MPCPTPNDDPIRTTVRFRRALVTAEKAFHEVRQRVASVLVAAVTVSAVCSAGNPRVPQGAPPAGDAPQAIVELKPSLDEHDFAGLLASASNDPASDPAPAAPPAELDLVMFLLSDPVVDASPLWALAPPGTPRSAGVPR